METEAANVRTMRFYCHFCSFRILDSNRNFFFVFQPFCGWYFSEFTRTIFLQTEVKQSVKWPHRFFDQTKRCYHATRSACGYFVDAVCHHLNCSTNHQDTFRTSNISQLETGTWDAIFWFGHARSQTHSHKLSLRRVSSLLVTWFIMLCVHTENHTNGKVIVLGL